MSSTNTDLHILYIYICIKQVNKLLEWTTYSAHFFDIPPTSLEHRVLLFSFNGFLKCLPLPVSNIINRKCDGTQFQKYIKYFLSHKNSLNLWCFYLIKNSLQLFLNWHIFLAYIVLIFQHVFIDKKSHIVRIFLDNCSNEIRISLNLNFINP